MRLRNFVFLALFLVATGIAGTVLIGRFAPMTAAFDRVQGLVVPPPQQLFGTDAIHVLVIGLDYDYDKLDQETSKSSRSDIIMALNLDFKHRRLSELSVPRDMIAVMPSGQRAKINQAQSEGGIRESKAVIAQWLGISGFDRYVVLRIDAAKDLVNAIGGIDVNVMNSDALRNAGPNGPVDYDDSWGHLHVHLRPGLQHLDGDRAVGYARFRHDWCSDPCRIMRQQQVIRAVVNKLEQDKVNTALHAQALLATIRRDIETDLSPREELSMALAFAHTRPADIRTAQVPYTASVLLPDYGDSLVPDEDAKRRLVTALLAPAPADVARAADATPVRLRLRVQNGTTVTGFAARVASDLRSQGFTVTEVGNAATHNVSITRVIGPTLDAAQSAHLSAVLGVRPEVFESPPIAGATDVTIVLGRDLVEKAR